MAQNVQIKTEYEEGTVVLHTPVFRRVIEETVRDFGDDVRIAKYKGDIPDWIQKVTGTEYLDALDYAEEDGRLKLVIWLIVRETIRFEDVAHRLIDAIKQRILERTGVTVSSVELVVTATFAAGKITDVEDVSYKD